ncbi:unnamed protein product [Vitrella brassicaformis CCMP3155]|uniref:RNA-binding protein 8A n=3 Tax=Vitrella brassicaformis TaxID=1169539 RepID=A0A0G4EH72_VITBC|nr:unnamed protein product [Vitrella brassicaformis CCMP3155]|mmetsp:Transcript_10321/g.24964  ORF Transcript_10321/g.24964 Transcript_10321/m.24964 type:complete len:152 (+) Transcript_10321:117-572(+)|eukprot:CEL95364.1 unnamed protein product [Vitrella brassicaformis CCMP3155]
MQSDEGDAGMRSGGRRIKGRGARDAMEVDDRYEGDAGVFQSLNQEGGSDEFGPARSIEGWIVIVTGLMEECQEEDLHEHFDQFGDIKNLHLNLDRRSGFVKGYCFIEYEKYQEAKAAIDAMNGKEILEKQVHVDWAFTKVPFNQKRGGRRR